MALRGNTGPKPVSDMTSRTIKFEKNDVLEALGVTVDPDHFATIGTDQKGHVSVTLRPNREADGK